MKTMKLLKKISQTPILPILGVIFLLIAGTLSYTSQNKTLKQKNVIPDNVVTITNVIETPVLTVTQKLIKFNPTATPVQIKVTIKNTLMPNPTSIPATSAPQTNKVTLSINGSSVESIDMAQGSNQCDVLSKALSEGKIQSLNMRYNSDMGTNAVYQINGIGKENSVWWTYKVNGQSPSQGCSLIKVQNGDNSQWNYIGN